MTLADKLFNCFKQQDSFTLTDAYNANQEKSTGNCQSKDI